MVILIGSLNNKSYLSYFLLNLTKGLTNVFNIFKISKFQNDCAKSCSLRSGEFFQLTLSSKVIVSKSPFIIIFV